MTKQALIKYRIEYRSRARRESTAKSLPHPSSFAKQRHKFEGRVFYALLELIANSLDATRQNQGARAITIELHEQKDPGGGPSTYCVSITDNGRGMDEAGLTACVTYGLSREGRGLDMTRLDGDEVKFLDSVFNRFGVGMMDASFSMGDDVYVMTKQTQDDEVRQVSLEYEEMLRKYNGADRELTYEFPIFSRDVAQPVYEDEPQIPEALSKYESIKAMVAREPVDGSFTTLVVRGVKPELVQQFFERDQSREGMSCKLADDLGHTYQFFMTAEPPNMNSMPPVPRCLTIHPEQPLCLQLRLPGVSDPIDTKDIASGHGPDGNLEHRLQKAGKNERWFFVRYYKGLAEAKEALAGASQAEKAKAQQKVDEKLSAAPYIALGVVRYYPSCAFVESHPMAAAPLDAQGERQAQALPEVQVECRWQGQTLVKQTEKMGSLPFAGRTVERADVADIPEVCFKRWRCTLLVSGHWDVGSNKMELALPDFSKELKHAEFSKFMTTAELAVFGTYEDWKKPIAVGGSGGWPEMWGRCGHDSQLRKDFRGWLRNCHSNHDEDLKYESPFAPDPVLRGQLDREDQVEGGSWQKVILSGARELSSGDWFMFKHKQNRTNVYAEAVLFCRDPAAEDSAGSVYFQQLPKEFYPQLVKEPLDLLIVESKMEFTVLKYDEKKKKRCKKAVAKELATKLPHRFVVSTSRSADVKTSTRVAEGAGVVTESNVHQYFFVDIVNQKNESLAAGDRVGVKVGDTKMQVRLVAHGPFKTKEEAQSADRNADLAPTGTDPPTKEMAVNDPKGCFKRYRPAGFYAMDFECVLDTEEVKARILAGQPLPAMPFPFDNHRREVLEVTGSKVHHFEYAPGFLFESGGMFDGGIRIGSETREEIELELTDRYNNPIRAGQDDLRGLTIVVTAKKDALSLEQRLDRSSGLKLTEKGTLLLTLGWKWPTHAAWNQPLSKAGKPAKFKVVLTSEIKRRTGVETLAKFVFDHRVDTLNLWPRAPKELLVDVPGVTIGDEEPTFNVTFADQNGNESLPIPEEKRTVEVSMKLGGHVFKMCKPTAPENVQEAVAICWNRAYTDKRFLRALKGQRSCDAQVTVKSASHVDVPEVTISVAISQPQTPVAAVVFCGAEEGSKTVSADRSSLGGLRIKLQNCLGNNVEWADQTPTQLTWNGDEVPDVSANYAGNLPDLDLSDACRVSQSYTFDGVAKFRDGDGTEIAISLQFEVNLVAGSAAAWAVETHEQSIRIDEPGQLEAAVSVHPVDTHGNRGADPERAAPTIELMDTTDSIELISGGFKEVSRAGVKTFQPRRNTCLRGLIDSRDTYANLRVSDAHSSLDPVNFRLKLEPGKPVGLRLKHDIMTQSGESQYNANVPAVWQLQGLEAMLVDKCGNSVPKKDVVLHLTGKNVSCDKLKQRTNENGTATFTARGDLSPARTLANGAGSYTLKVSAESSAQIEPVEMKCVVALTNLVTDLAVQLNTDETATAGELLPSGLVTVSLDTQDGEPFVPDASMFEVIIYQKTRKSWTPVATAAMHVSDEDDGISETTTWRAESGGQECTPTQAGDYKIEVSFTDKRSGLNSDHSESTTLKIAGGAAHHISPVGDMNFADSVTNGSDCAHRVVISRCELQVKDQYGNDTTLSEAGATVVATLHDAPMDGAPFVEQEEAARQADLKGGGLEGEQATAVGTSTGRYAFEKVSLQENAGGDSQRSMFIRFAVLATTGGIAPHDSPLFDFMPARLLSEQNQQESDCKAKLKAELRTVKKQLQSLDQALEDQRQELVAMDGSIESKQAALRSELDSMPGLTYQAADLGDEGKVGAFSAHCDAMQASIRSSKPKRRKALQQSMPGDGQRQYGEAVVEIACVADVAVARVLSWAAGSRIKAILVCDSRAQANLDELGRASFAENQLVPFQVQMAAQRRPRNASEKRKCMLPLQLPLREGETVTLKQGRGPTSTSTVHIGVEIPTPQFAVNMFDLAPDKEHYRDTLLWNIYRNALVVPSIDDARRYRQACAEKGRVCPSIYTLDGRRIQSDGCVAAICCVSIQNSSPIATVSFFVSSLHDAAAAVQGQQRMPMMTAVLSRCLLHASARRFNDPQARMSDRPEWCFGALPHDQYAAFGV